MISVGGWSGDVEAREQFAEIMTAALNGGETPTVEVPAEDTGPRTPRPNAAQGTSQGAMRPPTGAEMFAEWLTGIPYTDPNHVAGNRRGMSAAEAGQHAGWQHPLREATG